MGRGELRGQPTNRNGVLLLRSVLRQHARARRPSDRGHWLPGRPPAIRTVPFTGFENLRIFCMPDLKIIWYNQFTADSFCKREIIKVEFCENVIDHQETCALTATQLKELHLHLSKLKHIWNKDPQEIFSFQNPLEVHAIGSENMQGPCPGTEEGFPQIYEVNFDVHGVKEIVLRYQNSSVKRIQIGNY